MNHKNYFVLLVTGLAVFFSGCSSSPARLQQQEDNQQIAGPALKSADQTKKTPQSKTETDVVLMPQKKPAQKQISDIDLILKANKQLLQEKQKSSSRQPVNWVADRRYELRGDFADTPVAHGFIQRMVRKHGFDGNYLNMLFSEARDTGLRVKPLKPKSRKSSVGSWSRYRSYFITPRHINGGVAFWKRHQAELQRAYQQYGVPPEYIIGILGVETIYGGNIGKHRAIDALATKAFHRSRRTDFFQNELEKYLLMTRREGLNPLTLMGSSAGALGLCQFMPSNIKPLAVDYNRNGECNVWDPVDAIGSVANYFKNHGWQKGGPVAVRTTTRGKAYKALPWGYKKTYSIGRLAKNGVVPAGNIGSKPRLIKLSTYSGDEVWLGGHNFYVITRYNHSSKYAMAVHQLAQVVKKRYLANRTIAKAGH